MANNLRNARYIFVAAGSLLLSGTALAAGVSGLGTWETTLLARDVNNDQIIDAYYDTLQDITWMADANYAITSGYDADGKMNLADAYSYIDFLNVSNHLGENSWRLPIAYDTGSPGCDYSNSGGTDCGFFVDENFSELAHLHYVTLGGLSGPLGGFNCGEPVGCLTNTGPFQNFYQGEIRPVDYVYDEIYYWSTSVPELGGSGSWYYLFSAGAQLDGSARNEFRVLAVMDGDIGASVVPVPAAIWLFGSALAGLGWTRRRATRERI